MAATFLPPRSARLPTPRGATLIELMIGCLVSLLTGAALVSLQQSNYMASSTVQGQNFANASSRQPLDIVGDTLRNAQAVGVGTSSQALVAAFASDVTCYTATGTCRIWLDTGMHSLKRERIGAAGASGGQEILVAGVQSLQMTYYVPAGNAYNAGVANWVTTADPGAPSGAELPAVGAVNIVATVSANGETRTLQSFVRLRNSPNTHDS